MKKYKGKTMLMIGVLFTACMALLSSCKEDDDNILFDYQSGAITFSTDVVTLNSGGTKQTVEVLTPSGDTEFTIEKPASSQWLEASISGNIVTVAAEPNMGEVRTGVLSVIAGKWRKELSVTQEQVGAVKDVQVKITTARATNEQNTAADPYGVEKTYDGNYATYHNSTFGIFSAWPFYYEFDLELPNKIDYFMYHARRNVGSTTYGMWGEFECLVKLQGSTEFIKVGEYDHEYKFEGARYLLDKRYENVETIKILVNHGFNDRISCAEMEFFHYNDDKFDWSDIFTDGTCSELKAGVSKESIDNIPDGLYRNIALQLYNGTYQGKDRVATYRPYQDPNVMKVANKIRFPYSLKDNPTGIWVEEGETFYVFVGPTKGQSVGLRIEEMRGSTAHAIEQSAYLLSEGYNAVTAINRGLMYITNFTNDPIPLVLETPADKAAAEALSVKVHIVGGKVQGYWDATRGDTQEDFLRMLSEATYTEFDAYGKYAHLLWNVESWIKYQTDIVTLMEKMDWVVEREWEFMGLFKYDRILANRQHIQAGYGYGAAYATANRTNYNMGYYENLFTGRVFETRMWVLGHEIGHANQMDGLVWTGVGEVTNNIYCLDLQRKFGFAPEKMELMHATNNRSIAAARKAIVEAQKPHYMDNGEGDVYYQKLAPFWQLELYIAQALGYEDFYKDLFEYYRRNNLGSASAPQMQVNFVKSVCDVAKVDLTDFFVDWGFLRINSASAFAVTQAMIDEAKTHIAGENYPKPTVDVTLIDDANWNDFAGKVEAGWSVPVYN